MATEKRLIDANRLLRDPYFQEGRYPESHLLRMAIREQPTVDAVEVVRCKDCRLARVKDHREPTNTPRELVCQCFMHHHIPAPWGARLAVKPDDFCSYGERRTDG